MCLAPRLDRLHMCLAPRLDRPHIPPSLLGEPACPDAALLPRLASLCAAYALQQLTLAGWAQQNGGGERWAPTGTEAHSRQFELRKASHQIQRAGGRSRGNAVGAARRPVKQGPEARCRRRRGAYARVEAELRQGGVGKRGGEGAGQQQHEPRSSALGRLQPRMQKHARRRRASPASSSAQAYRHNQRPLRVLGWGGGHGSSQSSLDPEVGLARCRQVVGQVLKGALAGHDRLQGRSGGWVGWVGGQRSGAGSHGDGAGERTNRAELPVQAASAAAAPRRQHHAATAAPHFTASGPPPARTTGNAPPDLPQPTARCMPAMRSVRQVHTHTHLDEEAEHGDHGEAAVLDLLDLQPGRRRRVSCCARHASMGDAWAVLLPTAAPAESATCPPQHTRSSTAQRTTAQHACAPTLSSAKVSGSSARPRGSKASPAGGGGRAQGARSEQGDHRHRTRAAQAGQNSSSSGGSGKPGAVRGHAPGYRASRPSPMGPPLTR